MRGYKSIPLGEKEDLEKKVLSYYLLLPYKLYKLMAC